MLVAGRAFSAVSSSVRQSRVHLSQVPPLLVPESSEPPLLALQVALVKEREFCSYRCRT